MGQHKSLLVKFWAITFLILALLGLFSFSLKSQEAYFSYDMSEGDDNTGNDVMRCKIMGHFVDYK